MFGISLVELGLILIIALLITKPQDLPKVMRFCFKVFMKIKEYTSFIYEEFKKFKKEVGIEEVDETADFLKRQSQDAMRELEELEREMDNSSASQIDSEKEKEDS